jgi:hypothetical protein
LKSIIIITIALVLIIPITLFVLLPVDESIENTSNEDIIITESIENTSNEDILIGELIPKEQVGFNQAEK